MLEETEALAFITKTAPDLAAQVGGDGPFRTYVEAQKVWEERNREEAAWLRSLLGRRPATGSQTLFSQAPRSLLLNRSGCHSTT